MTLSSSAEPGCQSTRHTVNSSQPKIVWRVDRRLKHRVVTSWSAPQTPCCHCCDELTACCCRIKLPLLTATDREIPSYEKYIMYEVWHIACWRAVTTRAHTEQLAIVDFLIRLCNGWLLSTILSYIYVGRRYAVIIGPGPHWFHELQRSWFEQRSQIYTITHCSAHCTCSKQNTACDLLFTLVSAQSLVHFLSDGGDRGLLLRVIMTTFIQQKNVRQY